MLIEAALVDELSALGRETRDLAATIDDEAISRRLNEMAEEIETLLRPEVRPS
jgi:hypothetical protein